MAKKDLAVITLSGRLGKNVEARYTPNGKMVSNGSLAVNQWDGSTDWWDLTFWGEHWQNVSQYLTKGKAVTVSGRPVLRKWQDNNGNERTSPTVEVSEVQLGDGRTDDGQAAAQDDDQNILF